jgi:hypothetical protein
MTDQADDRSLPGEVVDMPPEERAAGLRELAELILDPNWLDRDTLENIEQLTDPEHKLPKRWR